MSLSYLPHISFGRGDRRGSDLACITEEATVSFKPETFAFCIAVQKAARLQEDYTR